MTSRSQAAAAAPSATVVGLAFAILYILLISMRLLLLVLSFRILIVAVGVLLYLVLLLSSSLLDPFHELGFSIVSNKYCCCCYCCFSHYIVCTSFWRLFISCIRFRKCVTSICSPNYIHTHSYKSRQ